jgi:hypothetical protein
VLSRLGLSLGLNLSPDFALGLGAVYVALLVILLLRARAHYRSIPPLPAASRSSGVPDCMVVIPARNEEGVIGRAVRSLPPDSVIVVDDGSEDRTAEEARQAGAGVLVLRALPKGVVGKPYACMTGAGALQTRWMLFADADTWYEPAFLESAVAAAEAGSLDVVSFHLPFEPSGLVEHALTPYAEALFYSGVDPREDPAPAFNGRCVLVRREAYEFIGGHAALTKYLVEDVKLAMLAQRHRLKIGLARAEGLGHARLHRGWGGLWEGLRRNAIRFTAISVWCGVLLLATALLTALWPAAALPLAATGQPLAAAGVALAPVVLLRPWYRSWLRALLAPLAALWILPIVLNAAAMSLAGARAEWKGRGV